MTQVAMDDVLFLQLAEKRLEEANRKLWIAERTLEDARLAQEGWVKSETIVGVDQYERWEHPSRFLIRRSPWTDNRVRWSFALTTPLSYSLAGFWFLTLDATLEAWRLATIDMGRYPELPPPRGLFARLR